MDPRSTRPLLAAGLPGIGGTLKSAPEDFVVEELPLYEPCGQGPHLYVRVARDGLTTDDVRRRVALAFGVRDDAVGSAGMKDKHARVIQTFSVLTSRDAPDGDLPGAAWVGTPVRHRNKLKPGHLLGNRFAVRVRGLSVPCDAARRRAEAIAEVCRRTGWPNWFGEQRQGVDADNAVRGLRILCGQERPPRQPWLRKLLLSAWQSERFDAWLLARLTAGVFDDLVAGDVCKKLDTGGLFDVPDAAAAAVEAPRLRAHAITYTGPLFGSEMRAATDGTPAAAAEAAILAAADLPPDALKRARLPGSRRPARLHPQDLSITAEPPAGGADDAGGALLFEFSLPKGAYATTVLREFSNLPA